MAKTPHRKNLGVTSGQTQRNRTTATPSVTTPAPMTTTGRPAVVTEPSALNGQAAAVWGQGVSLNHEKPPPSSVMIETPLNDVIHLHNSPTATQETTASQELSSRRASVMQSSSESTAPQLGSFTIILIALCCTYLHNSVWASCRS